jgi:hypothetical protein
MNGKLAVFMEMQAEIIRIAIEGGVQFYSIQIMNSVHRLANLNTSKDENR